MKSYQMNLEIRSAITERGLRHYEVANKLKITQTTFSHWLQSELSEDKKTKILKAIEEC